jgi:glycosyltransferase involved in cell wall biosynthesis
MDQSPPPPRLNIVYICRSVGSEAPWTAAQTRWITTLAHDPRVAHVLVLTTKSGTAALPSNVTMRQLARGSPARLYLSFIWEVLKSRPFGQDFFLVVQGGAYPAFLLPIKLLTGRPVYQWKAQPHVSRNMRFYVRHCSDLVFTATEHSLLIDSPKKRVIGHGIDTEAFFPVRETVDRDFITVGRISPIKSIEMMIRAISRCRDLYGVKPRLDIVGKTTGKSQAYVEHLRSLAQELSLERSITFLGHVPYSQLPSLLSRYRASLNFSATAFDKAVGEAMACGLPVITSNPCVIEVLPNDLRAWLATSPDDVETQAKALHRAMCWDTATERSLRSGVREYVQSHHNLASFFKTMLDEIASHQHETTSNSRSRTGERDRQAVSARP